MHTANVAYSKEYQEFRKTFDYVFQEKYKIKEEKQVLSDGKHTIHISYFNDESYEFSKYWVHTTLTEIFDSRLNKVSEFKNINQHVNLYSVIEHSNGKSYLIFSIDVFGYSIMDLSNYKVYHFIPEESFRENEETFIWTDVYYCKSNNILAVGGCYWAWPFSSEFFDFSSPESLPYKRLYSSNDMEGEIIIDAEVTPLRWNDDGTIVLKCCTDNDGEVEEERTVDIVSLINKKTKYQDSHK